MRVAFVLGVQQGSHAKQITERGHTERSPLRNCNWGVLYFILFNSCAVTSRGVSSRDE